MSAIKLLLRRDQRSGLTGMTIFSLDVRADLSAGEKDRIRRYTLQDTELAASHETTPGSGLLEVASRLAFKTVTLTVKDLEGGKRIEVKDVVELLGIEGHIRQAAQTFKEVPDAASHFAGEEVFELQACVPPDRSAPLVRRRHSGPGARRDPGAVERSRAAVARLAAGDHPGRRPVRHRHEIGLPHLRPVAGPAGDRGHRPRCRNPAPC